MPSLTALQQNIRRLMAEEGITYRGLAKAAGIDQSSVGRILSGTSMPRYATIARIAEVLRTTPALLMMDRTESASLFGEPVLEKETEKKATPPKSAKNTEGCVVKRINLSDAHLEDDEAPVEADVLAPPGTAVAEGAFCAFAENSSMAPTICEKDLVFFVRTSVSDVRSEDIVAARTEYGVLIGRLMKGACGVNWLTFDNTSAPGSQPVQIESVVAKAVSFYRQL